MSKKFSITKEIDLEKLNKEIQRYECVNNEKNLYLFMNLKTAQKIYEELSEKFQHVNLILQRD